MKQISMSVEELITNLSKYPPLAKVYFNSDGCYAEMAIMIWKLVEISLRCDGEISDDLKM